MQVMHQKLFYSKRKIDDGTETILKIQSSGQSKSLKLNNKLLIVLLEFNQTLNKGIFKKKSLK
jgi:hypothetical protein